MSGQSCRACGSKICICSDAEYAGAVPPRRPVTPIAYRPFFARHSADPWRQS